MDSYTHLWHAMLSLTHTIMTRNTHKIMTHNTSLQACVEHASTPQREAKSTYVCAHDPWLRISQKIITVHLYCSWRNQPDLVTLLGLSSTCENWFAFGMQDLMFISSGPVTCLWYFWLFSVLLFIFCTVFQSKRVADAFRAPKITMSIKHEHQFL